jgi:exopolyphosphatase/guanosine-5'-triphosphate,3'-diphosphate pyrophosphatase
VLERARAAAGLLWCAEARCARDCLPPRPDHEAQAASPVSAGTVRVAVVDLGTNTCRLLLGAIGGAWCGPIVLEERRTTVVRLGQGVDRSGHLAAAAVERTRACLAEYAALIDAYRPDVRRLNATSVLRDAADGRAFLAAVERDLGLPWRVLSGDQEAAAAFRGAVCGPAGRALRQALRGSGGRAPHVLVVDIGGGSTELIVGPVPDGAGRAAGQGPAPEFAVSMDVGAVRLTERCFRHDPPTEREWAAAVRWVRALLRREVPPALPDRVGGGMGVAGTISTLVANKLGLREFRSESVDGQPLHLWEIERAITGFRRLTSAQRGRLPGIQPGREDVILAGALIAREVCRAFGLPGLRCGESDILEGEALQLADEASGAR